MRGPDYRGDVTFETKEATIEIMANAVNSDIVDLFINGEPKISPYLEKN